jgi:hypothetical protein
MGKNRREEARSLEQLARRIEEMLLPPEATISANEKIRDADGMRHREVDGAIDYVLGTTPILITIEVRARSRKQHVQWIEEIAAKQRSVGAARTIAVAREFSALARAKAKVYGIELRRLNEVTDDDVLSWTKIRKVTTIVLHTQISEIVVACDAANRDAIGPVKLSASTAVTCKQQGALTPMFTRVRDRVGISPDDLLRHALKSNMDAWATCEAYGAPVTWCFEFNFPHPAIVVDTKVGPRFVRQVKLTCELSSETTLDHSPTGVHHVYDDPLGTLIVRHTEYDSKILDTSIILALQERPGSRLRPRPRLHHSSTRTTIRIHRKVAPKPNQD